MILNKKNITFLSDTPPLKNKGSGISVLLFNILTALEGGYNLNVITFCRETSVIPKQIIEDNIGKSVFVCDQAVFKLYGFVRFGIFKKIIQSISFFLSLPRIIKRFNNNQNMFITVVGASIKPVYKAWFLMKLAPKSKHSLYIVDDLELINRKNKNKVELFLISIFLGRTIKDSAVLITISEGLRGLYLKKYNKESKILFPHFKKATPLSKKNRKESEFVFLFTGGLNILYNHSLRFFASTIDKINNTGDFKPTLKLIIQTYSSYAEFEALGFNTAYVSYSTTDNRDELLEVYNQCNCFLVPYSFDEKDLGIVTTSFPQKIAEIIQYGRPILIFGPNDSSVIQFFQNNQLSYVCSERSSKAIREMLLRIIEDYDTFNDHNYVNSYNEFLSSDTVNRLFKSLNE